MKNDKKRQILFLVSLIGIILVLLTMGTTYAYQTIIVDYKEGSSNDLGINSANLDVEYTAGDKIELTNMALLKDYKTADYTEFKIDNKKSSNDASYSIDLINLEYSENIVSSDFKYTLVLVNDESEIIIGNGNFSDLSGNSFKLNFNLGAYRTLDKGNNETVRLYLWLKETENDQNGLENASFKGQIQISSMFSSDVNSIKTLSIKGNSVQQGIPTSATPIKIESVGAQNLFNKNNVDILNLTMLSGTFAASNEAYIVYIPCKENTTYIITRLAGNSFAVCNSVDKPADGVSYRIEGVSSFVNFGTSATTGTYTTTSGAKYLSIIIYGSGKTHTPEEILDSLQIKTVDSEIDAEYEIPITISSKNMVNVPDMNIKPTNTYYHNYFPTNPKVLLEPSTTYTLSFDYVINSTTQTLSTGIGYGTSYFAADIIYGKQFPNQTSGRQVVTFTTPSSFNSEQEPYLQLRLVRAGSAVTASVDISNVQLEKGSSATDYVPYKEPVTYNIYLDEPLRKVGDYADYIDYANGKLVRNIKYEYLDTVTTKSSNTGTYSVFLTDISKKPLVTNESTNNSVGYAMSNIFNYITNTYGNLVSTPNVIQPYITTGGVNRVAYTFDDSSINTVELAQEKIGDGFEVQYVMNESEIEYIELPSLKDLDSNSNITVCSSNNVCASNIE